MSHSFPFSMDIIQIMFLLFVVNGNYTSWSIWKECSATCGGGIQERSRTCTNPKPQNGGQDCAALGPAAETRSCNSQPCPSKNLEFTFGFETTSNGTFKNLNPVARNECNEVFSFNFFFLNEHLR